MTSTAAAKKGFGDAVKEYLGYTRNGIAHFFKKENQMWLSFLLSALILLASYFIFGVFPVGKQSVLSLDLNGQYVYYYDHMYDVLYGDESIFYSWSRNLSGEWMGIIGYYLGSPFNLIVWLFPRANILDGLLTMMCTKVGAIGLCMSIYLSRSKKCSKLSTVIFSICYALCSYTIVQTMNPMWLDGVMILPIICLGIERFVDQRRFRLLVAAWVYGFVTCFYIGFMLAIFSIIYFMLYMLITKHSEAREDFFKVAFSILGLGIVAVMISAFMLIPVYES
ncbi:MAG: YfhO family protein, partial [Ruminiclostridium sp.]|nr:YfhO family protein [Ruminiclostridium sp.]